MTEPALRIQRVDVDLGGRGVLRGIDLTVTQGCIVALIGPNGAGKTTLLRAVLGLVPLRAGSIHIEGQPATEVRGSIGYVPQRHEFAWDFPITARRAVMTGRVRRIGWLRRPSADDHRAVDEALDLTGLRELRDRPVRELSAGQRQRVLLARGLALRPRLLLLDEPFTGLDVPHQELLHNMLHTVRRGGGTIVITTHDMSAASSVSDRVCLLNQRIVAEGPPETLHDPAAWLEAFGVSTPTRVTAAGGTQ